MLWFSPSGHFVVVGVTVVAVVRFQAFVDLLLFNILASAVRPLSHVPISLILI